MSGKNIIASLEHQGLDVVAIDMGRDTLLSLDRLGVDVIFNILHGKPGEDGTVQGMLELLGIPYTGSGVLASAVAMNKIVTKRILLREGVLTPHFSVVEEWKDLERAVRDVLDMIEFPLFMKPAEEGSSVGAEILKSDDGILERFAEERKQFGTFFAEQYIEGMIATCGVLGTGKDAYALPVLELVPVNEFYDFEAKYTKGMTEFIIPARLADAVSEATQKLAVATHRIIGCCGFSRVDFVIKDSDMPYVLEINTIPGMTEVSDLPAEAESIGMSYDELVMEILSSSISRFKRGGV
jgi:D-alanine-D-alanine ligase